MKLIALTQRVTESPTYYEKRDSLDKQWWDLLIKCEIIPIIIPNNLELAQNILKTLNIDGIILTGGNSTEERNNVEKFLIETAINKNLPLLGVCHGMQAIQRYYGVQLHSVNNQVRPKQTILINNEPRIVNSYHTLGTKENHPEFIVWAKTYDNLIKAISHTKYKITGIMWHPERMQPYAVEDIELITTIFASKSRSQLTNI